MSHQAPMRIVWMMILSGAIAFATRPVTAQFPRELGKKLDTSGPFGRETSYGCAIINRGLNGLFYVVNPVENVFWAFNREGEVIERITPLELDLKDISDLAVDGLGHLILAGRGGIRVLARDGTTLRSFGLAGVQAHVSTGTSTPAPAKRSHVRSVVVLRDGSIVAAGSSGNHLITVFDSAGAKLHSFGEKIEAPHDRAIEGILNAGTIIVDDDENLYYLFSFNPQPTIRKYSRQGVLLAEWRPRGFALDHIAKSAEITKLESDPERGGAERVYGSLLLGHGTYHAESASMFFFTGSVLLRVKSTGETVGEFIPVGLDGKPFIGRSLIADGDLLIMSSGSSSPYKFPLPPLD